VITCPKCNATLPDWAQTCQFCQADVKAVARPVAPAAPKQSLTASTSPGWVAGAYYALCVFFLLEGAYDILRAVMITQEKVMGSVVGWGFESFLGVIVGAFTCLIGLGLLLRVEFIRGIVNFFCGLRILFGLVGLLGSLGGVLLFGALGFLFLVMNVVDIATAAFMIYLIGETDKRAPNL
jgi:hypothetical protein